MHPDLDRILISREQLQRRVGELGATLAADYAGRELLLIGILKGAIVFLADLSRALDIPHEFDLIGASSYGPRAASSGQVRITKDVENVLRDKDVLLIEDIYDTGRTLAKICEIIRVREPRSLEICCLLEKPGTHEVEVPVKYIGFEIPDEFVVGYGLDYAERYRNLNDIGVLKKSIYEHEH